MSWPKKVYSKGSCVYTPNLNDPNLGMSYNGLIASGRLIDAKNFLHLGRVRASSTRTLLGKQLKCTDNTCMAGQTGVSSGFPATGLIPITVTAIVHPHPSGNQCIAVATRQNAGTADSWNMFLINNNLHVERYDYNGSANGYYRPATTTTVTGLPFFALGGIDPVNNTIYVGMNGILYSGFTAGAALAYSARGFFIGGFQDSSVTANFTGRIGNVSLYNQLKDAAWFRKEWVKIAQAVQFKTDWGCKESTANENTVGNFVGNGSTPFEILSGTWKLATTTQFDEPTKTIQCVAAGTLWLDRRFLAINNVEAAYGAWRTRITHLAGTTSYVGLVCSAKSAFASHNGYALKIDTTDSRSVIRHAGAAENYVVGCPDGQVNHVNRRFDSVWSEFSRIDTYPTNWNDVGFTGTDATYTTSEGMCFTMNVGDEICLGNLRDDNNLIKFLGEFSPQEV
jgi:hypothetical protein